MLKNRQSKKSVVLAELLLAVVFLTTGLAAVVAAMLSLSGALNYSQNKINAVYFLDNKISSMQESILNGEKWDNFPTQGIAEMENRKFQWQIRIEKVKLNEATDSGVIRVSCDVSWLESGAPKQESIVTYLRSS